MHVYLHSLWPSETGWSISASPLCQEKALVLTEEINTEWERDKEVDRGSHWKRVCEVTATSKAHRSSPCRGGTPGKDERREKGWWEKTPGEAGWEEEKAMRCSDVNWIKPAVRPGATSMKGRGWRTFSLVHKQATKRFWWKIILKLLIFYWKIKELKPISQANGTLRNWAVWENKLIAGAVCSPYESQHFEVYIIPSFVICRPFKLELKYN